ncbi:MAG TPA: trypsin-like peptidase domain-containing protein [Acidimicrobiales bacterium]|nr:trypsin-like peptidase domain-containing protein [Acidimicrobiales bacterium]
MQPPRPPYGAAAPTGPTTPLDPHPRAAAPAGADLRPAGRGAPSLRAFVTIGVVAALIGGGVGAGVVALTKNSNTSPSVTIHESNAAPGAAVLNASGVTIPELVKAVIPAVVSIDVKAGDNEDEGTGMIITSNGEVVTNNHVIEIYAQAGNVGSITVTEYGQKTSLPATLLGYNTSQDVALLRINNASGLKTVTFGDSGKAEVGDSVVAIGNALGLAAGTPTVTSGIVSALGRSVTASGTGSESETLQNLIQTDAAINPGNSGGPLIDTEGQVIGMNTAVAGTTQDGESSQNIGFAIPIATVESLIPDLQKGLQTPSGGGYLGVDITTLTSSLRQQYGFTPTAGAVVLDVIPGSPADKAGLQQGDVIVDVNGSGITSAQELQSDIQKAKAGQQITVTYYRGSNKSTVNVTLGSQQEAASQEQQQQGLQIIP